MCPEWIRVRPSGSPRFREVERVLREQGLRIVGEPDAKEKAEAHCIISIGNSTHYEQTPTRRCLLLI